MENKQWNSFFRCCYQISREVHEKSKKILSLLSSLLFLAFVCSQQFNLLSLSMKCCSLLSLRVVCFWISLHFLNWNEMKWEEKCENVECCYFLLVFPYWNHPITITNDTLQGKGFPRSEIKSEGKPSHWKFRGSESESGVIRRVVFLSSIARNSLSLILRWHFEAFVNWYAF